MPRPIGSTKTPSYRRHRASGQAIVTIAGRDHYLGPWKSKASRLEYDRLIAEWLSSGRQGPAPEGDTDLAELILRYWKWAESYYASGDSESHGHIDGLRAALKITRELYGDTPAVSFGPLALRTIRDAMVAKGWVRTHVNQQVGRVKRFVKWCVAHELLPASAHHALQTVDGLKYGKSAARESAPVKPVAAPFVDAVLPFLSVQCKAMVELQGVTGMRSGEITQMTSGAIDRTVQPWSYRPGQHKNLHRGHERVVYLGARAQELITPFLKLDPGAYLFSPKAAEHDRRAKRYELRKTPHGQGNCIGTNRKRRPAKAPGDRYTTSSYRRAVAEACDKAFPPSAPLAKADDETWKAWRERLTVEQKMALRAWRKEHRFRPHQLRHNHATDVRRRYGLEAVQAALGQKSVTAAQIYAEKDQEVAKRIAAEVG